MNLIAACVANPVKVTVGVIFVTLFGVLALLSMPVQLTPEVQIPTITVDARWRGASPQEVEQELVLPLEEQLRSVEGLVRLSSESSDSVGTVGLEFTVDTDLAETHWTCVAWPQARTVTGNETYWTNHTGEILRTLGGRYDGRTLVPEAGAALLGSTPNSMLNGKVAANTIASDGNRWMTVQ